ncbi:MAG: ABC transporter permease [Acidobacteriota bacterium]
MIADMLTLVWKEWKEMFLNRVEWKGGLFSSIIVPLFIMGIFMPWQSGRDWVRSPAQAVVWTWLPLFLVAIFTAESFAGERERKTLESLLASRLSDRAILFGKLAAVVGYGWGMVPAATLLGVVTVSLKLGEVVLPPAQTMIVVFVMSLLVSLLAASGGILISLRAPTVRQAGQILSLVLMSLVFVMVFGGRMIPPPWKARLAAAFAAPNLTRTALVAGAVLALIDAVLLAAAIARFKRARLILD